MSDIFNLYVEAGSPNGDDQPQSAQRWAADEIKRLNKRVDMMKSCLEEGLEVWDEYLTTGGGSPVAHSRFVRQAKKFNDEAKCLIAV